MSPGEIAAKFAKLFGDFEPKQEDEQNWTFGHCSLYFDDEKRIWSVGVVHHSYDWSTGCSDCDVNEFYTNSDFELAMFGAARKNFEIQIDLLAESLSEQAQYEYETMEEVMSE